LNLLYESALKGGNMKTIQIILPCLLVTVFLLFAQALHASDYTNSIGMEFKLISAGSFYMGSCKQSEADKEANKKRKFMDMPAESANCPLGLSLEDNKAADDETPQHKVHISKSFYIGIYEVTLGQFKKFIAGAGRYELLSDDFMKYNRQGDNAAVCYVSWDDAQAFIKWLNEKEKGKHYRLPTEAEWEYAVRAGTTTKYSWGDSEIFIDSYAWYWKNAGDAGEAYAHPVGLKKPNPWGLYDIHGNVYEWVQDWYDDNYYSKSPSSDPLGPSLGTYRVIRGGSWLDFPWYVRAANRDRNEPDNRYGDLGFRLCLSQVR
jgi:formylglycine-generating enzyme required for sulfatase activity